MPYNGDIFRKLDEELDRSATVNRVHLPCGCVTQGNEVLRSCPEARAIYSQVVLTAPFDNPAPGPGAHNCSSNVRTDRSPHYPEYLRHLGFDTP